MGLCGTNLIVLLTFSTRKDLPDFRVSLAPLVLGMDMEAMSWFLWIAIHQLYSMLTTR